MTLISRVGARLSGIIALAALLSLTGCVAQKKFDYTAFRNHPPRSIAVIAPLNESTDVNGTYGYLSTVTMPLVERGYYVFPVAMVDQYLKNNGVPTAGEMRQVPLSKYGEILGADAVLDITLKQYGTKYVVIDSVTTVSATGKLTDVKSGTVIWTGDVTVSQGTGGSSGGNPLAALIVTLVKAAVDQIANSVTDHAHDLSPMANAMLVSNPNTGLLPGPYFGEEGKHTIAQNNPEIGVSKAAKAN